MTALVFWGPGRQKKYGRHAEVAIKYDCNVPQYINYFAFGNTVVTQHRNERTAAMVTLLARIVPAPLNERDAIRIEKYGEFEKIQRRNVNVIDKITL
ncbi:MAG: hypothetical protein ABI656_09985 [bacterium]